MSPHAVTLLGATGRVGRRILATLESQGREVIAISRTRRVSQPDRGVTWHQADLTEPGEVARCPWTPVVISTLQVDRTADICGQIQDRGVNRLIAFSSTSTATKRQARDAADRLVAAQLQQGELRLRLSGWQTTILRPTLIYHGPGDRNIERIVWQLRNFPAFPLVGQGLGLRQPVHAMDLAWAACAALDKVESAGQVLDLAGGERLTFRDMVTRTGEANGLRVKFVNVPRRLARGALLAAKVLPSFRSLPLGAVDRMGQDLTFDIEPARMTLGYIPRKFSPPRYP